MPHGGYHGTVIMGGNVIQQGGTGPNAGKPPSSSSNNQSNLNKIKKQKKRLDEINKIEDIDARSKFLASKTPKAIINKAQQERIQAAKQRNLKERLARGKSVARPEFTGNYGDGLFGLNIGATPTGRPKITEGMTGSQYADYMSGLYNIAPERMQGMFPFASGKTARTVAQTLMPFGSVFSTIADAYQSGKGKVKGLASSIADEFSGTLSGLKSLLPTSVGGANVPDEFVAKKFTDQSSPDDSPLAGEELNTSTDTPDVEEILNSSYYGRSPMDEMYTSLPSTQFGKEFLERVGPRKDLTTLKQSETPMSSNLNYNEPLVNMTALLSPTVKDFAENSAGTEPYEQPVLDFAMERAPDKYQKALNFFENKYPDKSPLDYVNMMNQLQKTPYFPKTLAFNPNFLPSAQTPIQYNEGGLASLNNKDYSMLMNASNFGF